jgi:septal ring factor EnvC (AmiA/AmiB activator)
LDRVDAHLAPITGKFLVGTVPCLLRFTFDNEYSWLREKLISYRVTVTPPSAEILLAGRRRRAKACLKAIEDDLSSAKQRLESASQQKVSLQSEIQSLEKQLAEKKKSFDFASKEDAWLTSRVELRMKQKDLLDERLLKGWDDELSEITKE